MGGYFKLDLLPLWSLIVKIIIIPPEAQQTSNRSKTSGESLAGTQVGALRPDQGKNGCCDADTEDNADKSIPKRVNVFGWPISLKKPQIKSQRYLKTHVR